jgi:hypothetical protein
MKRNAEPFGAPATDLLALAQKYLEESDLSRSTVDGMLTAVRAFCKWYESSDTSSFLPAQFSEDLLNLFLSERPLRSNNTLAQDRAHILRLWHYATRRGMVGAPDYSRLDVYKQSRARRTSWSLEEIYTILAACARWRRNNRRGWDERHDRALILFILDTGLDLRACLEVAPAELTEDGMVRDQWLGHTSMAAIREIPVQSNDGSAGRLFNWPGSVDAYNYRFRKIVEFADLPGNGPNGIEKLRRSIPAWRSRPRLSPPIAAARESRTAPVIARSTSGAGSTRTIVGRSRVTKWRAPDALALPVRITGDARSIGSLDLLLEAYAKDAGVNRASVRNSRVYVRAFAAWHLVAFGQVFHPAQFSEQTFNAFLAALREGEEEKPPAQRSAFRTLLKKRGGLLRLWRYAAACGLGAAPDCSKILNYPYPELGVDGTVRPTGAQYAPACEIKATRPRADCAATKSLPHPPPDLATDFDDLMALFIEYAKAATLKPSSAAAAAVNVRAFSRWHIDAFGCTFRPTQFSVTKLNAFLKMVRDEQDDKAPAARLSVSTLRKRRNDLVKLWRYAAKRGVADWPETPRIIRFPGLPRPVANRRMPPIDATADNPRDKFCYDEGVRKTPLKKIKGQVSRTRDWKPLKSDRGARKAGDAYARRNRLKPIENRRCTGRGPQLDFDYDALGERCYVVWSENWQKKLALAKLASEFGEYAPLDLGTVYRIGQFHAEQNDKPPLVPRGPRRLRGCDPDHAARDAWLEAEFDKGTEWETIREKWPEAFGKKLSVQGIKGAINRRRRLAGRGPIPPRRKGGNKRRPKDLQTPRRKMGRPSCASRDEAWQADWKSGRYPSKAAMARAIRVSVDVLKKGLASKPGRRTGKKVGG